MQIAEYLKQFLVKLDELRGVDDGTGDAPSAIDAEDGQLTVLVPMGDLRYRLPVAELDPDPVRAATEVHAQWEARDLVGQWDRCEGRRG